MSKDAALIQKNIKSKSQAILLNTKKLFLKKYDVVNLSNKHNALDNKGFKETINTSM